MLHETDLDEPVLARHQELIVALECLGLTEPRFAALGQKPQRVVLEAIVIFGFVLAPETRRRAVNHDSSTIQCLVHFQFGREPQFAKSVKGPGDSDEASAALD